MCLIGTLRPIESCNSILVYGPAKSHMVGDTQMCKHDKKLWLSPTLNKLINGFLVGNIKALS